MTLPFPATSEEFEEYRRVMDEMADESDRLPDPQPEDLTHLGGDFRDDSHLDPDPNDFPEDYDDGCAGDPYGRDDDYSEYGQEGCCGDF
jgi:hypothetical protein